MAHVLVLLIVRRAALSLLLLGLGACALPGPPTAPLPSPLYVDDSLAPGLRLVEGQPRGLLLELSLPASAQAPPPASLGLFRQSLIGEEAQGGFDLRFTFTPEAHPGLWSSGRARFLDTELREGVTYRYTLVTIAGEDEGARSPLASLTWRRPLAPPEGLRAEVTGPHIALRWRSAEGSAAEGIQVFRRQIGRGKHQRLPGPLRSPEGVYVDLAPAPGVVYGYLVSAVRWEEGVPLVGPPSAELYVESSP